MKFKEKIYALLPLLAPVLAAVLFHFEQDRGFDYFFPISLLSVWAIATACISWHSKKAEYVPNANQSIEIPDEMVFTIPRSENEYLKKVFYNWKSIKTSTCNYIFLIIYLFYLVLRGIGLGFSIILLVFNVALLYVELSNTKKWHKLRHAELKKQSAMLLLNQNGLYTTIPRLTGNHGQTVEHILIAHANWGKIKSVRFFNTHAELAFTTNGKEYLVFNGETEKNKLKALVMKNFKQETGATANALTLVNYESELKALVHPAISLLSEECNSFNLGDSYIAPIPSVPKNFKWPTNHGLPLSFLAQVNCKELSEHDSTGLLPQTGMLYFFYEMREMLLNEEGNRGCVRIVYSNVPKEQLVFDKDSTKTVNQNFLLRQRKLRFKKKVVLPPFEDAARKSEAVAISNQITYSQMCHIFKKKMKIGERERAEIGDMLGTPYFNNGHELGIENRDDLVLLFQLTLTKADFYAYLMSMNDFSEKGRATREFFENWDDLPCQLYFFIPRENLKKLDFTDIMFMQRGTLR